MNELYQALKAYSCLDHFAFDGERLVFEYPGIGVSFNIVKYAGLYPVRVDGREIFNNPDPLEVVDFIMVS